MTRGMSFLHSATLTPAADEPSTQLSPRTGSRADRGEPRRVLVLKYRALQEKERRYSRAQASHRIRANPCSRRPQARNWSTTLGITAGHPGQGMRSDD
jgi:hypothetical protein